MKTTSRLTGMLRRLNIDVTHCLDLNLPLVSRAAVVCETCQSADECETWLRRAKQDHGDRAFCPNTALLDCLPRSAAITQGDRVA